MAADRRRRLLLRRGRRGRPPRPGTALVRIPGAGRRARGRRGGLPLAGVWAAEALRIAAWRPRCGAETDDKTIPHELDLLRTAVHLAKGCYKGQETIARVHNLGHPPRRLVFLQLDGSQHTLPAVGQRRAVPATKRGGHDLRGAALRNGSDRPGRGQALGRSGQAELTVVDGDESVRRRPGNHRHHRRRPGGGPADRVPARAALRRREVSAGGYGTKLRLARSSAGLPPSGFRRPRSPGSRPAPARPRWIHVSATAG